ncbi:hypothetical protein K7X08_004650 [Anisodus acutangulus]|uniref:Uncharacterized protein n=1 Tax=Anisodus acutangulus TaxID=402998 RepID=A0A9Q1MFI5_9SOLA|nr:hypothetical protein K7X08_004650 [Anisodus acutangulus]
MLHSWTRCGSEEAIVCSMPCMLFAVWHNLEAQLANVCLRFLIMVVLDFWVIQIRLYLFVWKSYIAFPMVLGKEALELVVLPYMCIFCSLIVEGEILGFIEVFRIMIQL